MVSAGARFGTLISNRSKNGKVNSNPRNYRRWEKPPISMGTLRKNKRQRVSDGVGASPKAETLQGFK
jgi:hypothetical protein